jgi:hypothetical protein
MRINNLFNVIWKNVQKLNVAALAAAGLIAGVSLVMGCANPAGGDDEGKKNITPTFVAVTNINISLGGTPYSEENNMTAPGTLINLSAAAVEPETATNKTIVWGIVKAEDIPAELVSEKSIDTDDVLLEVEDGEDAGAGAIFGDSEDVDGNSIKTVTPNSAGTLVLQAVIANGLAAGTAYEQIFVIKAVDGYVPPEPTDPIDPTDPTTPGGPNVPVTNVAITLDNATITQLSLNASDTAQLGYAITPPTATNQDISWTSDATTIVSVNASGLITAVSAGQANITAKNIVNNKSAVLTVTVVLGKGVYNTATDEKLNGLDADNADTDIKKALTYIKDHGEDYGEYTIVLANNEDITETYKLGTFDNINGTNSHTGAKKNLKITLKSVNEGTTVTLTKTVAGAMFFIYGYNTQDVPTLILDRGITLHGFAENTLSLVIVGNGSEAKKAKFEMQANSEIKENIITSTNLVGGGILINRYSEFIMRNGKIHNNKLNGATASYGAGVACKGSFIMLNGTIKENKNTPSTGAANGGGVYVYANGSFVMSGGQITNNIAQGTSGYGGGVYSADNFTMTDDALIGYNKAGALGGGVFFSGNSKTFAMSGGSIAGNKIEESEATNKYGSGVFKLNGNFYKTGGIIYGVDVGELSNNTTNPQDLLPENVYSVKVGTTPAVAFYNDTAGTGVNLSSTNNNTLTYP